MRGGQPTPSPAGRLVQQHLAAVGAGEEDGQRLLLLSRRYDRVVRRQSDIWETLQDSDHGARGLHQREVLCSLLLDAYLLTQPQQLGGTHCQGTAAVRRGRASSPSQCSRARDLPIAPVGSRGRHLRTGLSVGAGSRGRTLRRLRAARAVERRRPVPRRGAARWSFGLCGRLSGRRGRDGELGAVGGVG